MYEYKFIKIELKTAGVLKPVEAKEDYHKIIDEHAEQGWRLVQIFAPGTGIYGAAAHFELIFEKNINAV